MDDLIYGSAYISIVFQIALNGVFLILFGLQLGVLAYRGTNDGEGKIAILNRLAFCAFSLVVGIVLMQLLLNETVEPWLLLAASCATAFLLVPVDYFYRKRVSSPDQLQTKDRSLSDTNAHAFVEQADLLSQKQNQPESTIHKD